MTAPLGGSRLVVVVLDPGLDGTGLCSVVVPMEGNVEARHLVHRFNALGWDGRCQRIERITLLKGLPPTEPMAARLTALAAQLQEVVAELVAVPGTVVRLVCEIPATSGRYTSREGAVGEGAMAARTDKMHQAIGALTAGAGLLGHRVQYVRPLRSAKAIKTQAAADILTRNGFKAPKNKDVLDAVALALNITVEA